MGEAVFLTANLNVSPNFGVRGTSLAFTGSGFTPGETVNIFAAGIGSPVVASAVADSGGSITATGRAPQAAFGERVFFGTGQTSGKLGAPYFQIAPSLIPTPDVEPPGTTVALQGYGFGSFEALDLDFGNDPLGSVGASIRGTFSGSTTFTFTVPMSTSPGTYSITANPSITGYPSASTSFTVQ
jgi:hypothetical protein